VPVGAAFLLRSLTAQRRAGYFVVLTIFISAAVAAVESVLRLVNPPDHQPDHHRRHPAHHGAVVANDRRARAALSSASAGQAVMPRVVVSGAPRVHNVT